MFTLAISEDATVSVSSNIFKEIDRTIGLIRSLILAVASCAYEYRNLRVTATEIGEQDLAQQDGGQ